jgi:signal transduction histidine kinase/CheY-like chemotaxis protein
VSLQTLVRAMAATQQPTCLFWGPALINLYNDGFIPLLGEKHPTAMGQPARLCWADAWPVVGDLLNGVVTRGDAVMFHEMLIPIVRDGALSDAWWNYSYSPAFDDGGARAGVLVVATETTAAVIGRKQLEAANRTKDEFLAMVSHELRNPLNAILGWSRLMLTSKDPNRLERGLSVIDRNATLQAKLIDDILDMARIMSDKVTLDLRRAPLATVIQMAVDSVRPAAAAKQITLEVNIEEAAIDFICDVDRLQQVAWNLLTNAVKFTPAGGKVRVAARQVGSRVTISVEDSGQGIPAALLPHVFERFRQGDSSSTKRHAGLGLGLAIVRHLVDMHGGVVRAHSDGEGRGATFTVELPIRAVEPRASTIPAAAAGGPPVDHPTLAGVHVLVVDDEDDARELLSTVLQESGARVTTASSARAAMDALASDAVAVIVSDVAMPAEDGYSLMQRLRAAGPPAARDIPALALTAFAGVEDRQRAAEAGFQVHLAKPVDPAALVAAVAALARSSHRKHTADL